jgi:hypothetical protein
MKYFNEASVLYMFLTLDIGGLNGIRLISRPFHAPSHELENTETNTPPTKLISKRILVGLLGIREESFVPYLWGMNSLDYFAYFSMLKFFYYILVYGAWWLLMLDGDSLIPLDVMKVDFLLHILSYHDSPLFRPIIVGFVLLYVYFVVTSTGLWLLFIFYLIGRKIGFVGPYVYARFIK